MKKTREKTLPIHAINVVAQPHPEGVYVRLFDEARKRRTYVKYYGSRYGYIASFEPYTDGYYAGKVYTFTDFDRTRPWLDENSQKVLSEKDLTSTIPPHLKPEFESFDFLLLPGKDHRVILDTSSISIGSAYKIFYGSLYQPRVLKAAGTKDCTLHVEQDHEGIDRILALESIRSLTIVVSRKNGDSLDDFTKNVDEELEEQHCQEYRQILKADAEHGSLQPNKKTKQYMQESLSEGWTTARGYEKGARRIGTYSTQDHPLVELTVYVPEEETVLDVLARKAKRILTRIARRKG